MVKVCLELGTPKGRVDKRSLYADVELLFDMYPFEQYAEREPGHFHHRFHPDVQTA